MRIAHLAFAIAIFAVTAQADTIWSESIHGDLSGDTTAPTPLSFTEGANKIIGTIGGGGPSQEPMRRDGFTFQIDPGETLDSVIVDQYTPDGNTTGFNVFHGTGTGSVIGTTSFGVSHLGTDILLSATGPLGPGNYEIELREFGAAQSYELTFNVSGLPDPNPEPGTIVLVALAAGAALAIRRRRARRTT
ncbi:MAG: PEP-CTERM sorting domain-containing protein [Planctomycetota bacterium]|jgi:hypothetical protein